MLSLANESLQNALSILNSAAYSHEVDAQIAVIEKLPEFQKIKSLDALYHSAQVLAEKGNTSGIALIHLVRERFNVDPHTKILLYFYTIAETNRAKSMLQEDIANEKKEEIYKALENISQVLHAIKELSQPSEGTDELLR